MFRFAPNVARLEGRKIPPNGENAKAMVPIEATHGVSWSGIDFIFVFANAPA